MLVLARVEFRMVAATLTQAANALPGVGNVLALEMRRRPDWPPMMAFLLWLRHRESPMGRHILELLRASQAVFPPPLQL
jgi:hypothetical protein